MPIWLDALAQISILAYAALGGVFLAFSDFIMRALSVTKGAGGPDAMQAINREVFRYVFMGLFLGMTPLSLVLAIGAAMMDAPPALIAGGLLYVFGVFGVTAARNVPMNNALAALDPASAEAMAYWRETYLPRWTFWNSVRTTACFAAAAIMLFGVN